jgi:hypothetical protein
MARLAVFLALPVLSSAACTTDTCCVAIGACAGNTGPTPGGRLSISTTVAGTTTYGFDCGPFAQYKANAVALRAGHYPTFETCCDHLCTSVTCDSNLGWTDMPNKAVMVGGDVATCCDRKCEGTGNTTSPTNPKIACPSGMHDKTGYATISGSTVQECCDPDIVGKCTGNSPGYTADVVCPAGQHLKPNSNTNVGMTQAQCCDLNKCSGNPDTNDDVNCPAGYEYKSNSANINGYTNSVCCDQIMCSSFTCTAPAVHQASPTSRPGTTAADCCETVGKCTGNSPGYTVDVVCPAGQHLKPNSYTNVGTTQAQCCDLNKCSGNLDTNNDVNCPAGYEYKSNSANIDGYTNSVCCDQIMCSSFTCTAPATRKASPASRPGTTAADCCETQGMCSGNTVGVANYPCPINFQLKPNSGLVFGSSQTACCDRTMCSGHTCSTDKHLKPTANSIQAVNGNTDDALCCDTDMCSGNPSGIGDHTCTGAKQALKPNSASSTGSTDAICCEVKGYCTGNTQSSSDVQCDPRNEGFYAQHQNYADMVGTTFAQCCTPVIRWRCRCVSDSIFTVRTSLQTLTCRRLCSGNTNAADDVTCNQGSVLKPYSDIIVIDPGTLSASSSASPQAQKQLICCNAPPPTPQAPSLKCRGNSDDTADFICDLNQYGTSDPSHMYIADSTSITCPVEPIVVTMTIPGNMAALGASRQAFEDAFKTDIATVLSIAASRITVTSLAASSIDTLRFVKVEYNIAMAADNTQLIDTAVRTALVRPIDYTAIRASTVIPGDGEWAPYASAVTANFVTIVGPSTSTGAMLQAAPTKSSSGTAASTSSVFSTVFVTIGTVLLLV